MDEQLGLGIHPFVKIELDLPTCVSLIVALILAVTFLSGCMVLCWFHVLREATVRRGLNRIFSFVTLISNCGPWEYNNGMLGAQFKLSLPCARFVYSIVIFLGPIEQTHIA